MDFSQIEKKINYTFKDKNLLRRALTLSSKDNTENNETLEFFGDAILEFIVSEKIFDENSSEGLLTEKRKALVSDGALRSVSEKLGLDKALRRSAGDSNNKKAIPSAYEAVVAAIYLDGGMSAAKEFVHATLDFTVRAEKHPKCQLLEYLQSKGESCPDFDKCTIDTGSARRHCFKTELPLFGQTFIGEGESKSEAQSEAAKKALVFIQSENK